MNTIKSFQITHDDDFHQVILRVDTAVLTPELAHDINAFWGGADDRLEQQGGDVVEAVVRLFGTQCIQRLLEEGGCEFASDDVDQQRRITQDVLQAEVEGWPDIDGLGMLIASADVYPVEFNSTKLTALPDVPGGAS